MSVRTSDEAKQNYIAVMGNELGSLYHRLWNEVAWLHAKWEDYVELFGTKPSRIELLNEAAGHFFRIIQDTLWDDALLHIARLTDAPQIRRRENLSIRRLPRLMPTAAGRSEVQSKLTHAMAKTDFCRDWRNRRIAHLDLQLAVSGGAEPLKPASRELVRTAMDSITDVLNAVSLHFMDSTSNFEAGGNFNGALDLIYVIDSGLRSESERRARLKAGTPLPADYQRRDL